MKQVGKCPLSFPIFPTCDKATLFSLFLGEAATHSFALQMCSALLGVAPCWGGYTPGKRNHRSLATPHEGTWEHAGCRSIPWADDWAAGHCPGSQRGAGPAAAAEHICLHAPVVADEDDQGIF